MKAMKAKAMKAASTSKALTKGALSREIAAEHSLNAKKVSQILDSLAGIGKEELKKTGVFHVPGLCRIKIKNEPARKEREKMFSRGSFLSPAKPARDVLKAFLHSLRSLQW